MSQLNVQGRSLNIQRVTPVKAGEETAAMRALAKNGADDVMVKIGQDTFVASGRGLALRGVKADDKVTLDGREGRVVMVDRQLNSFKDGMLAWPGLVTGGAIGAWGMAGFVQGVLAGANMAGIGLIMAAGGVALGLAINAVPAIYGHFRKVD